MIEYIEGDIFKSPAQVIVNTVNTMGVMGKGLALEYKKRYPEMFDAYRKACDKHLLTIGKLMLYYAPDHTILMFPTKENWRNPSKIEYIEAGLNTFVRRYAEKGITSIAFPKLGCGNGELIWDDVRPVMEQYLKPLPITIYIYIGIYEAIDPEHKKQDETMAWLRTHALDMSFRGLCDDLQHGHDLLPYSIRCEAGRYQGLWNEKGLVFRDEASGTEHLYSLNEMEQAWDDARNRAVFLARSGDGVQLLFYRLLHQLGYLSPVRLNDPKTNKMEEGYQVNAGNGRVFVLRGDAE